MNRNGAEKLRFTIGIYAMMLVSAFCTSAQGTLLSDFIGQYHLESSAQGLMSAAQSAGNLCAVFLIGLLVGKLRKSTVLAIAAVATPCVFFLLGMQPVFAAALGAFFVYGIAFGFLDSLASSMMADLYQSDSARYMNLLHGCYGVGGLTGPLIIRWMRLSGVAWYGVMQICALAALIAAAAYLAALLTAGSIRRQFAAQPNRLHSSDLAGYLRERRKCLLLVCAFLYGAHQMGITVWVTRYISEYLHEPRWGAAALSCFWLGITASRLILARFRPPRKQTILICHCVTAAATAAGVLSGSGSIMTACCGIAGCAEGPVLPFTLDIACEWEGERSCLGSTMVLFAHYTGFIVCAPAVAFVIARIGIRSGMILPALLSAIAAVVCARLIRTGAGCSARR